MKEKIDMLLAAGFTRGEIITALLEQIETTAPSTDSPTAADPTAAAIVNKHCILRCAGAGVHAGVVTAVHSDTVLLAPGSLRLWRWYAVGGKGALHAVAVLGLDLNRVELRVEQAHAEVRLTGVLEAIATTKEAQATMVPKW